MIVFDNIIFSLQKAGGISVVWSELLKNILTSGLDFCSLEYSGSDLNLFKKNLRIPPHYIEDRGKINRNLCQLFKVNYTYREKFIFHSSYFRTCKNKNAINVTTVHDFINEQSKTSLKQKLRIRLNYRAIRNSDAIVCISENTKRDLFKFLPDIDPQKVSVIYNGVSTDYTRLDTTPYPELSDCILFVGGRTSYKNFVFTVNAIKNTKYRLLICGNPLNSEEVYLLNSTIPNRYKFVKFPSNEELNKIYNSVLCLAYPSSYEGFGIPILEAQRAGCPVIALNASSVPEVIGEGGILLNELSIDSFVNSVSSLGNSNFKESIINKGVTNSLRFSWEKMAMEYISLYKNLLM